MTCAKCGRDNSAHTLFCMGCGQKLEVSREGIEAQLRGEIRGEKERHGEDVAFRFLFILLPLAIFAWFFRGDEPRLPSFDELPAVAGGIAPVKAFGELPIETAGVPFVRHQVMETSPFLNRSHRSLLAEAHGGGEDTEKAVEAALRFLALSQQRNGRWVSEPGAAVRHETGLTGLSLLAFTGAGYSADPTVNGGAENPHAKIVAAGAKYLSEIQQKEAFPSGDPNPVAGLFLEKAALDGPDGRNYMYDQALATAALAELGALTKGPDGEKFRKAAERGARFLLRAQRDSGGWGYHIGAESQADSSVSSWPVQALKTCVDAGVLDRAAVQASFDRARAFFLGLTNPTGFVGYNTPQAMQADGYGTTAAALTARLFMGVSRSDKEGWKAVDEQAAILLQRLPAWEPGSASLDLYRWYYSTIALFQVGGRPFAVWNDALKKTLLSRQGADGTFESADAWAKSGPGRVYSTAMAVLCLEVYYRYPGWE